MIISTCDFYLFPSLVFYLWIFVLWVFLPAHVSLEISDWGGWGSWTGLTDFHRRSSITKALFPVTIHQESITSICPRKMFRFIHCFPNALVEGVAWEIWASHTSHLQLNSFCSLCSAGCSFIFEDWALAWALALSNCSGAEGVWMKTASPTVEELKFNTIKLL